MERFWMKTKETSVDGHFQLVFFDCIPVRVPCKDLGK